jgi:hypothetical protein
VIRINLLPADLRRGNRLPAQACSPLRLGRRWQPAPRLAGSAIVYFGDLGNAEQSLQSVEVKLAEKEQRVAYHDAARTKPEGLRRARADDPGRSASRVACGPSSPTNSSMSSTRRRHLDRHLAWFRSISVKGDPKKGASVTMPASVQGDESSRVANFHEDLEGAPFYPDLIQKSDPTWRLVIEKDRTPSASLDFPLVLQFKPTVVEPAAKKAAAKTPPAATPAK